MPEPGRSSGSGGNMSITSKCLVCEHPDGGSAHFGSTSCLACAAFFRRTVSLNIIFECKRDKNCTIFHELRMICRACRFEKCVVAGMKRDCVQKRRSNKKTPKKHQHNALIIQQLQQQQQQHHLVTSSNSLDLLDDIKFECAADTTDDNSPLSLDKKSPMAMIDSPIGLHHLLQRCKEEEEASTSYGYPDSPQPPLQEKKRQESRSREREILSPSPCDREFRILNMTGPDLLRHYVDELKKTMDRRRMMFSDTPLLAIMEDRGDMPYEKIYPRPPPHTMQRQYEAQKFDNLLAFEFCRACPGFDLMDGMERAIFYRMCTLGYALLDIAWITVKAYEVEEEEPLVMYTDGSVSTVRDLSYGWEDEEGLVRGEKKKLFSNFVARFHEAVCRPFRSMRLDYVEYAAFKAFCIWKLGYCEYTNNMKLIGKEHEEALMIGLRAYYEDTLEEPFEIAERIGNLILLMGTVFEINQLILETYKSAELFALFRMDNLSKTLLSL